MTMTMMAATWLAAASGQVPNGGAIDQALAGAVREVAADRMVTCTRTQRRTSFACQQRFPGDTDHYALFAVEAEPARRPIRPGAFIIDDTFMGPGGGTLRYRAQTADHRYDVVYSGGDRLRTGQRSHLPLAPAFIKRVMALYESVSSGRSSVRRLP